MNKLTPKTCSLNGTKPTLVCRLRHQVEGRRGPPSPTAGEVEIENVSPDPIEIEVTMHPLQYLSLVITDSADNLVPVSPYGDIFSPRETPYNFCLLPGEKYIHNVGLLGYIPEVPQLPGIYTVRAVYEYKGIQAISDPLLVELTGKQPTKIV